MILKVSNPTSLLQHTQEGRRTKPTEQGMKQKKSVLAMLVTREVTLVPIVLSGAYTVKRQVTSLTYVCIKTKKRGGEIQI